ncbi:Prephenate dehydratase-domain-containing protein [Macrophomina phaseolina]|uniref:prephenate dehydratase n=1 Tax=Macrophomina phaseolina TaxID=35725 RepID=A0ABQ8G4T6_9PEZI|nr:Prephenate dehydratase-domain-containing protein [Macrophomina phaseolina]
MAIQDKVLFLGPEGTYTHQAALSFFPTASPLHPTASIASVFAGVQSGGYTHGVVPIENSSNGGVVPTWDLLAAAASSHPDVLICGEAFVPVRHALLGRRCPSQNASAKGSPCLAHVKTLYSHPQAWGQCTKALGSGPLGRARRVDADSTSAAARLVSEDVRGESAAVASVAAARVHGLDVLVEDVSDFSGNTTRFFVLRRAGGRVDEMVARSAQGEGEAGRWSALVAFTLAEPERVAEALGALARYAVPVANVVTRPSVGGKAWERVFMVELVLGGKAPADVEAALVELGRVVPGWRWLGSWESKLPQ